MPKKRKSNDKAAGGGGGRDEEKGPTKRPQDDDDDDGHESESSSSSSSDDDSLVLEGTLVRNPDASDSSGSDDDDDDDDDELSSEEEDDEEDEPSKKRAKKKSDPKGDAAVVASKKKKGGPGKAATNNGNNNNEKKKKEQQPQQKKKKQKQRPSDDDGGGGPETIQVEFLFCDVHERFFHGMKTLLHRNAVHAPHSSQLADLIIENEMVGTVLSTDVVDEGKKKKKPTSSKSKAVVQQQPQPQDDDANVFGLASIINVTTNSSSPTIQSLKSLCLKHCPSRHRMEMETVLSGKTKRPAGFFFHERMVNVPLEITHVLHNQLVLDMDHAVESADDEAERRSLDFGAFVRLAPCVVGGEGEGNTTTGAIYKYFDDEVFATNAEFSYDFETPRSSREEEENDDTRENERCSVIVLTKTGHRKAMEELKKMIHGG